MRASSLSNSHTVQRSVAFWRAFPSIYSDVASVRIEMQYGVAAETSA